FARHGFGPHREGGYYRRVHVSKTDVQVDGRRRPAMTAIRYLLGAGGRSEWHRIDADEAWHWQQGGVLELLQFDEARGTLSRTRLGPGPDGEGLCRIVPAGTWQAASAARGSALVVCSVAPGFAWQGFEMLDPRSDTARALERLGVVQS